MTERAFVRCDSHRARAQVQRVCGVENTTPWFVWSPTKTRLTVHGLEIPSERLDECLAIKSVRRWRVNVEELRRPW